MAMTKVAKFDVANNHVQTAIDLFLEKKDYLCALSLAGAAEEILGQYAKRENKTPMLDLICSVVNEELSSSIDHKTLKKEFLNKAKNTIKHFDNNESEYIEIDPESEAIMMLLRAIGNLHYQNRTVTTNTPAFFEWVSTNRSDLF